MLETCADCSTTYAVGSPACPNCGSTRTTTPAPSGLPTVVVACHNQGCRAVGAERRVLLRTVAPGVMERPSLCCAACGHAMWTVTPWPPVLETKEDGTVPKITRHGGASNAAAAVSSAAVADQPEPAAGGVVKDAPVVGEGGPEELAPPEKEGGEQPSPGSSSSTSSEKPSTSSEPSKPASRKRARTTASRSAKGPTGSRTAPSTGGGPTERTSAADESGG